MAYPAEKQVSDRLGSSIREFEASIEVVEKQVEHYEGVARKQRLRHNIAKATAALLGVATPVLVTYQVQQDNQYLNIAAILLTSLAGAASAMQVAFRWGDGFVRAILTSLSLKELLASMKLKKHELLDTTDTVKAYLDIVKENERALSDIQRIIRRQVEGEVAVITQERESPPLKKDEKETST